MTISTRPLSYTDQDLQLTGELHWDATHPDGQPGILLVHGGAGLDEHARGQAGRYAALGYTVLACDMFGPGVAGDRERVVACVTRLRDEPALLVRRALAGLTALAECPEVAGPLGAVGFCFGGMTVLALARAGANLAAVVSMHGSLATSAPARQGDVKASVLICHGALDPYVPMADVTALADEMSQAGADWQVIMYGSAVHGFTHSNAVPGAIPGVVYDPLVDERSFAAARAFLAERLVSDR